MKTIVRIIALLTLISGLVQMCFPTLVLKVVGASTEPAPAHFFAIVGMFMALFGGMLLHVLRAQSQDPIPVFWSALQKLGAAIAVPLGVIKGIFSLIALGVAGFDFISAIIFFIYWNRLRKNN